MPGCMAPIVLEWLNLLFRVAHVLAAIMWVGDSFLFMFLDSHLVAPSRPREGDVQGELWMTHSGGFYELVKRKSLKASELPPVLHWFKWESYTTWITGFFLLGWVYYLGGSGLLVDDASPLGHVAAIHVSLGILFGGAVVYHLLCGTPLVANNRVFGAVGLVLITALAWGLSHIFTPRAVYLQVGATLGTIMSSNVMLRIIPAQRHMLAATKADQPVDTSYGARAKQRSVHNHYLSIPVLFMMVSNHLPVVYGGRFGWLVLALVSVFAVGVKYFMNFRRATHPVILLGGAGALVGAIALADPRASLQHPPELADAPPVSWATVDEIIRSRCVTCHMKQPTNPGFVAPPLGVTLETPQQVKDHADRILVRAVLTRTMPLGNITGMTDRERTLLGAWVVQGASLEAQGDSALSSPAQAFARVVWTDRCSTCHGASGKGDGAVGVTLNPRPRDFGDAAWQASVDDAHLRKVIVEGGAAVGKSPLMAPNLDLRDKPEVVDELVKQVRALGGK